MSIKRLIYSMIIFQIGLAMVLVYEQSFFLPPMSYHSFISMKLLLKLKIPSMQKCKVV